VDEPLGEESGAHDVYGAMDGDELQNQRIGAAHSRVV
jgi:hypothetical protein